MAVALAGVTAAVWFYFQGGRAASVLESTAQAVVFAWLLLNAAEGFKGPLVDGVLGSCVGAFEYDGASGSDGERTEARCSVG
jgi:hypothetical protein